MHMFHSNRNMSTLLCGNESDETRVLSSDVCLKQGEVSCVCFFCVSGACVVMLLPAG